MLKNKFQKLISLTLSFTLISVEGPCNSSGLIHVNKNGPVVPPAKVEVSQIGTTSDVSIKSIESKITDIVRPKKHKSKLQETYSGTCGENARWNLNTDTGVLTIFGSGKMSDYHLLGSYCWANMGCDFDTPWYPQGNSVKSVEIRDGVTYIGNWAFGTYYRSYMGSTVDIGYHNLNSIKIPNTVTEIGESAFRKCNANSIKLPDSLLYIRSYAFFNCNGLTSMNIPDSVIEIGEKAFQYCHYLTSVSLGKGVANIASDAFSDCTKLTSVTLNNDYAVANFRTIFPNYADLTTVTLGEGVTTIPESTFMGCEKLKSVVIPASVKSIGEYAFSFCSSLTDFTYRGTADLGVANIFDDSPNLKAVNVSTSYQDEEFCGLPIAICGACGNSLAWKLQPTTGSMDISGSGAMINYTLSSPAPWNLYKLDIKSLTIGDGVSTVGDNAFSSCDNLTSIDLPSSVTYIGTNAFLSCNNLNSINLPGSVTHIGTDAFSSCEKLSSASFYGSKEPSTNGPVFSQSDELTEVNVPTVYENETFCGIPVAKTIILPAQTSTAPTEASQTSSSASTSTPTYEFTPSLDPEDDNGSSSLGTGAIIGIITGSVVPILTAIIGAGWAIKHNKCCYKEQKQEIHIDGTGHEIVIKA